MIAVVAVNRLSSDDVNQVDVLAIEVDVLVNEVDVVVRFVDTRRGERII